MKGCQENKMYEKRIEITYSSLCPKEGRL